jgi:rhodanese-related sulfurtransferase
MRTKKLLVLVLFLLLAGGLISCNSDKTEIEAVRLHSNSYLIVSKNEFSQQIGDLITIYFPDNLEQPPLGSLAKISLGPEIRESYPPQADAKSVKIVDEKASVLTDPNVAERIAWHLGENAYLIDVRSESEYVEGHLSGAILMPSEDFAERLPAEIPDRETVILLYCRTGNRSSAALKQAQDLGYIVAINAGGVVDYEGELVTGSEPGPRPGAE